MKAASQPRVKHGKTRTVAVADGLDLDRQETLDDFRQETELYEAILSREVEKVRRLCLMGGKNIMNAKDRVS